ncbi:MAG: DNA polymerase III subunit delta', partial [Alphaproteobacteria bacterium]
GRPRSEIVVGDVRAAREFLRMTPAESGWRVIVVDPVEDMNPTAANALLKILEEPPRNALLLLVSHKPGALLPTIRSRCCRLALAPLREEVLNGLLARYLPELSADERAALTRLSGGSAGRACDLAAGGGLDLYREIVALLQAGPPLDVERVYAFAEQIARAARGGGEGAETFRIASELLSALVARLVRESVIESATAEAMPGEAVPGEGALIRRLGAGGGLARRLALWDKISRLFARAETASLDRKHVIVTALLEIEAAAGPPDRHRVTRT